MNKDQAQVIVVKPAEPAVTSWDYVANAINAGAFAVLVFEVVIVLAIGRKLREAWEYHLALLEELKLATRTNAQSLETNAASLRRLSLANERVARKLEADWDNEEQRQAILAELRKSIKVIDCASGTITFNTDD